MRFVAMGANSDGRLRIGLRVDACQDDRRVRTRERSAHSGWLTTTGTR